MLGSVRARDWPPLLLPAGVRHAAAGPGVKAALLGTVSRAGGARQVTYNGWPLYLWQGDQEPGQATGQADDMGLWYVLSASGAVDTPAGFGAVGRLMRDPHRRDVGAQGEPGAVTAASTWTCPARAKVRVSGTVMSVSYSAGSRSTRRR